MSDSVTDGPTSREALASKKSIFGLSFDQAAKNEPKVGLTPLMVHSVWGQPVNIKNQKFRSCNQSHYH